MKLPRLDAEETQEDCKVVSHYLRNWEKKIVFIFKLNYSEGKKYITLSLSLSCTIETKDKDDMINDIPLLVSPHLGLHKHHTVLPEGARHQVRQRCLTLTLKVLTQANKLLP